MSLPSPAPIALSPDSAAAYRRALAQVASHGVVAAPGQAWVHRATGTRIVLVARGHFGWGAEIHPEVGPTVPIDVPLDVLDADYAYAACDHGSFCCPDHDTHALGHHRGCRSRRR